MYRKILIGLQGLLLMANPIRAEEANSLNYQEIVPALEASLEANHYNPAELKGAGYQETIAKVRALANSNPSKEAFINGYNNIWQDGPFSHVVLVKAQGSAADMAAYFDSMRVGDGGAQLSWRDDIAVLTVNTMMGQDTIERIDQAYEEIVQKTARALIIDLRANAGGAFAVRPLVSHLLDTPVDTGSFVARNWFAAHAAPPEATDIEAFTPWEGWSLRTFWADVQSSALIRIQLAPYGARFDGPVYVLTSSKTASAAEMATAALKDAGRATIIGEKTAGEMLTQKMYDIPGGFHLAVPIGDYYAAKSGRIEGNGIAPHIETDQEKALDIALEMIRTR